MDGEVEVQLRQARRAAVVPPATRGLGRRSTASRRARRWAGSCARRGHMTLLPAGRAYRFHADAARRDPAADHRGPRHHLALGRDLPDRRRSRGREEDDDHDDRPSRHRARGSVEPNDHGYRTSRSASSRSAATSTSPTSTGRPARHVMSRRRLPAGAAARRGVGLLLRHRQLRRRVRHGQPLRQRRPVRRPLQRRLPQGRARPHRELRHADRSWRRFEAMLDDWTNEGFDPFAAPQETGTPFGPKNGDNNAADHPRTGSPPSAWSACRATSRSAPTTPATRSTARSPTCRRTSPRSTPSRASRTRCARSTCSPTCRAPT